MKSRAGAALPGILGRILLSRIKAGQGNHPYTGRPLGGGCIENL
jgi:hypothetical protein